MTILDTARHALSAALPLRLRRRLKRALNVRPAPAPEPCGAAPPPLGPGQPFVTVVVPCYNYGQFVAEAVASVRAQTLRSWELIVVDDGSDDPGTAAALGALERDGIRVLRQPNAGLPTARNVGIAAGHGRYVCCLDADDALAPTYLEKCVTVLEAEPAAGFAYSWIRFFGDDDRLWETRDFDLAVAAQRNHASAAAVFRRDAWGAVGGYSPAMRGGYEDWEFWIRLALGGWAGRAIPEPLFLHRRHGRTMTHEAQGRHAELLGRIRASAPAAFDRRERRAVARRPAQRWDDPFANLRDPALFGAPAHGAERVLLLIEGSALACAPRRLPPLPPGELHAVVFGLCEPEDAAALADRAVVRLPDSMLRPCDRNAYLAALCAGLRPGVVATLGSGLDALAASLARGPAAILPTPAQSPA